MDLLTSLACAHTLPGVSHRILHQLRKYPEDIQELLRKPVPSLLHKYHIAPRYHERLYTQIQSQYESILRHTIETYSIHLSDPHEHTSTFGLQTIEDPPAILYSTAPLVTSPTPIGVVGARAMSPYGKEVTKYFVRSLALQGHTIISGYAYGVDQEAHDTASILEAPSVAVLGCGLDIFLRETPVLPAHIQFCSDFPLGTRASRFTFPLRNRIISGLAAGVLIIEAQQKSGTLTTAHYTLRQGKPLWIVPGDIFAEQLYGSHDLLRQHLGIFVTHPQDIYDTLPQYTPTPVQQKILNHIHHSCDQATLQTQLPILPSLLTQELSSLVQKGLLQKTPEGYSKTLSHQQKVS